MSERAPVLVVLAGGSNSRFWPLKGKSLFPFLGEPLIARQLRTLIKIGFRQIVVIGNPENRERIERLGQTLGGGVDFRVTVQREARGMGDALLTLRSVLDDAPSPLPAYVCQVHDVFDPALHEEMLTSYFRAKDTTWLASYKVKDYFPGGYLVVDDDLNVTRIVEKPGVGSEPSDLVNIVAHVHPDLWQLLGYIEEEYRKPSSTDDHYERAMMQLMRKRPFKAVPYSGPWHPIKYPWHVLGVMEYLLSQMQSQVAASAQIADSVNISGSVYIADNVRILDGATIVGPAYIGLGTLVGQQAHIRHSMVEARCTVGLGSEVNRSYIGSSSMMHSAKALDSVIAGKVNLSAGVITANLRGDGASVKSKVKDERVDTGLAKLGSMIGEGTFVGIGAMLMPGIKIGENSIVGPSTLVKNDVPDQTLHYAEQRYVSKPLFVREDEE